MITQEYLKECLTYDPDTGDFSWNIRPRSHFKLDLTHNTFNTETRLKDPCKRRLNRSNNRIYGWIAISPFQFSAHRLAWLYVHGEWPKKQIDHINGDSTDNKIINLRDVTPQENLRNQAIAKNNTSGFTGVIWDKANNQWRACIKVDNKLIHLGCFSDKEDAIQARKKANIKYRFHKNHGSPKVKFKHKV